VADEEERKLTKKSLSFRQSKTAKIRSRNPSVTAALMKLLEVFGTNPVEPLNIGARQGETSLLKGRHLSPRELERPHR